MTSAVIAYILLVKKLVGDTVTSAVIAYILLDNRRALSEHKLRHVGRTAKAAGATLPHVDAALLGRRVPGAPPPPSFVDAVHASAVGYSVAAVGACLTDRLHCGCTPPSPPFRSATPPRLVPVARPPPQSPLLERSAVF